MGRAVGSDVAAVEGSRIATRYDKLARNYASALALAAVVAFWC